MHILRIALLGAGALSLFGASSYDPLFFKALEWRNIGPNRGGRSISAAGSTPAHSAVVNIGSFDGHGTAHSLYLDLESRFAFVFIGVDPERNIPGRFRERC